jgi:hypothetical protein
MIEAPPSLRFWRYVNAVRFDGPRTFIRLDCDHERPIVLSADMERDPAKLIRLKSRFPCRTCSREAGETS